MSEQPPMQNNSIDSVMDTDWLTPVELTDYPAVAQLGRRDWINISEAGDLLDRAEVEYSAMCRDVEAQTNSLIQVEKAGSQSGDEDMVVPGTLRSKISTILMHCILKNIADARSYLNDLAINGVTDEEITAHNQLAPLVGALELIDRFKETE